MALEGGDHFHGGAVILAVARHRVAIFKKLLTYKVSSLIATTIWYAGEILSGPASWFEFVYCD